MDSSTPNKHLLILQAASTTSKKRKKSDANKNKNAASDGYEPDGSINIGMLNINHNAKDGIKKKESEKGKKSKRDR